ncbi:2Fe-2S iron-sulfur cluster binding domain-containing protein [Streptomyces sp. NPDC005731]
MHAQEFRKALADRCMRVLSGTYETDDRGMFSADELAAGWRLACRTLPTGDLVIGR